MTTYRIPFNRPTVVGDEETYLSETIQSLHLSGDGPFTRKCRQLLQDVLGVRASLLTTSCTHALELSALLLDIQPGDEVIIPSFTFVSTANAYALRGGRPVFIDIRPDTLNLDENQLESLITPRTKVVIPVHYAGIAAEMTPIMEIAARHGVIVVEDAAHALFGKYKDQWLGTLGAMSAQSFHETKNFTCGEGGALLINDPQYLERAEIMREKGTNRSRFFRGEVDRYTWVDLGSSYLPSDLLAAFLFAQLQAREMVQDRRKHLWETYLAQLAGWAGEQGVALPAVPAGCAPSYHLFFMVLPTPDARVRFIEFLKGRGIHAVFHYLSLHLSDMGRHFGGRDGDCPITESVSERMVRLPFFTNMTSAEQEEVISAVLDFNV